ncbi:MAG: ATP-dependent Clp protease proteolytic subunit, partial [Bacteroidetes bacterium]|nr:ATP-dependent Clp protease proteolytic subunit [Bacteroidota bacterium]
MEAAIRFLAPVNNQTADQLFKAIDVKVGQGCRKLHLLISSPGGSVFHGLSLYNYLKGIPVEIYTYNFGSVDSIGVVIYCAGIKRFSVPHSRFLIHGVKFNLNSPASIDEKQLEEYLKSLQIDQRNIAKVIADNTNKTIEDIEKDMHNRTTLNPEEANVYGLTHEIKSELIKPNMEMLTIGEPMQG